MWEFFDMKSTSFALPSVRASQYSRREESNGGHERTGAHKSVMVKEVVHYLAPQAGEVVVDATYGVGGHSKALKNHAKIKLIALDADPSVRSGQNSVITKNFAHLAEVLVEKGIKSIDKALFDLGWNRSQLEAGRGFSFLHDEPLTMSYGPEPLSGFLACDVLNSWSEKTIADVLFGYGEERYARRIARAVVERRHLKPIETTIEFVEIIRDAVPARYRHGRIHFATRSFQALRIAVNDELGAIERGVRAAWDYLSCGGRIAVITFHSIEDRAVKKLFASFVKNSHGSLVFKKPLTASKEELAKNPSARSAKLRVIEKVCTD